jgi:hypothetical protein
MAFAGEARCYGYAHSTEPNPFHLHDQLTFPESVTLALGLAPSDPRAMMLAGDSSAHIDTAAAPERQQ